jgi:type IV fimbrial biogenesis protein FimT
MRKMLQEGVTLIEALVTLGIVSVALAVGVPAVRDIVATNRMSSAVNDIVTSLHISRNEAVKRAEQTVLCASTQWSLPAAQCEDVNLAEGWIVFTDDNPRNGARDAAEIVVFAHQPLGQGITLTSENLVRFSDLGIPTIDAPGDIEFLLCDERGNRVSGDVTAGRKINMTATGRPQVVATLAEVNC